MPAADSSGLKMQSCRMWYFSVMALQPWLARRTQVEEHPVNPGTTCCVPGQYWKSLTLKRHRAHSKAAANHGQEANVDSQDRRLAPQRCKERMILHERSAGIIQEVLKHLLSRSRVAGHLWGQMYCYSFGAARERTCFKTRLLRKRVQQDHVGLMHRLASSLSLDVLPHAVEVCHVDSVRGTVVPH